jgi:predicted RNA-binding protein with RPS1 domain|tara:strand:+ start:513 stop:749 length:237 start_codon:yes stop_codon:yes gene_type:complete
MSENPKVKKRKYTKRKSKLTLALDHIDSILSETTKKKRRKRNVKKTKKSNTENLDQRISKDTKRKATHQKDNKNKTVG